MKITLSEIGKILYGNKQGSDTHTYGEVKSINPDGSYQVALAGAEGTTKCAKLMGAKVGDTVMVTIMKNGHSVVTGTVGGDSDAADALSIANDAYDIADDAMDAVEGTITGDTLHYLAYEYDTGVTTRTQGWTTTPQTITTAKPYLWTYHTYHYHDGDYIDTTPVISGVYGPKGADGQDGTDGTDGEDGTDGKGVTNVQTQYYLSTSNQTLSGGSWSNTPQTFIHGRYYWTKEHITYTDTSESYSTAVYNAALTDANEKAWNANSIAEGIEQHFWTQDGTGTEAGVHITEVPQDEWTDPNSQNYHKGGDVLIKSVGMYIRLAAQVLASFLQDGVRLFSTTGNLLASFLASGLDVYDGAGHTIAHLGYGSGASQTGTADAPYYDLGTRTTGTTIGNRSLIQGEECEASAVNCSAHGYHTKASGIFAFACGSYSEATNTYAFAANSGKARGVGSAALNSAYAVGEHSTALGSGTYANGKRSLATGVGTTANGDNQAVFGKFNKPDATSLLIVGNGINSSNPHNAFSMDDDGRMKVNEQNPFTILHCTVDNYSVGIGEQKTVTLTYGSSSNYTPLGVVGFNVSNATNSGANSSKIWVRGAYLNNSIPEVKVVNRKTGESDGAAVIKVEVDVLATVMQ